MEEKNGENEGRGLKLIKAKLPNEH